jgi:hypothetical protein
MKHKSILGILACVAFILVGCGSNTRAVKSEEELKSILAEAFSKGDIDSVGSLYDSSTDPELKKDMLAAFKPVFEIKPTTVVPSVVKLSEAPMNLPGELNGKKLKYTTDVSGVIFLDGQSTGEHGVNKIGLYFPFSHSSEGYTLAGIAFDSKE